MTRNVDHIANWRVKDENGKVIVGETYQMLPFRVYAPNGMAPNGIQPLLSGRAHVLALTEDYDSFIRLLCKRANVLWLFEPHELNVFYLEDKQWRLAM
jgi:hypothetical protein